MLPRTYRFRDFELDERRLELRRHGTRLTVEPRVFELLRVLIRHRNRVVSKDELLDAVWGDRDVSESSLTRCVSEARRVLGDRAGQEGVIRTYYGAGYRFAAAVQEAPDAEQVGAGPAAGSLPFVGRDRELARLQAALGRLVEGEGELLLVVGEAGIGKTRLLEEGLAASRAAGIPPRLARCPESRRVPPFWPWLQLLRTEAEDLSPEGLRELLGPGASDVVAILPELRDWLPGLPEAPAIAPYRAQLRLFDSVTRFLRRLSREGPRVLAIDDLHRADPSSLRLLEFAASDLRDAPILWVATLREADLQRSATRSRSVAALAQSVAPSWLRLEGLRDADVARLTGAVLGRAPDPALEARLREVTNGNPFFLTQLLPLLLEAPEGGAEAAGCLRGDALPRSIRDAVTRQLESLPVPARSALRLASVLGRTFEEEVLAAALGCDVPELRERLRGAHEAGVLAPRGPGIDGFAHALVRDVLYEDVASGERAALHLRVGEALEGLTAQAPEPPLTQLADHFFEARAIAPERAIRHAARAARSAAERLAWEEAVAQGRRVVTLLEGRGDVAQCCDALLALGRAELRAGQREAARTTLGRAAEAARKLECTRRLAEAALAVDEGFLALETGVSDPWLCDLLREALAAVGDDDGELRTRLLARLAMALHRDEALPVAEEALAEGLRLPDGEAKALAMIAWHTCGAAPPPVGDERPMVDALTALATRLSSPETELIARSIRVATLMRAGETLEARLEIAAYRDLATRVREPQAAWYAGMFETMLLLLSGRFEEAEREGQAFLRVGARVGDANALQAFGLVLAVLRWEQGRLAELRAILDSMVGQNPHVLSWRAALAFVHSELDRWDDARAMLRELGADGFARLQRSSYFEGAATLLAEVCAGLGDASAARSLYARLEGSAGCHVVLGFGAACFGSADRPLGVLAATCDRFDAAERHLEAALRADARLGSLVWVAHTRHALVRMLLRRDAPGDRSRALELARTTLADARERGLANLARKLEGLAVEASRRSRG